MTIPITPATEPRACTMCLSRDRRRPATHVARAADGLEWFECGDHDANDNLAGTLRLAREPIAAWYQRHDLQMPGAAPIAEFGGLTRDLTAARVALSRVEPSWLVKDFCALYQAARAEVSESESPTAIGEAEIALRAQLERLRPAFEVCESERLGARDRRAGERVSVRDATDAEQLAALREHLDPRHEEARPYPDDPADDETPAAGVTRPVFDLTPAARDYYMSDLRYRAPEHLSPRDRLIIEAVQADEALRAESPDEWIGPEVKP